MAPCLLVVFDPPALWHLDAARGPSTPSLDHLVGATAQRQRNCETERLSGPKIKHQFNFHCLLDRKVARFLSLEHAAHVDAFLAMRIVKTAAIAHQPTYLWKISGRVHSWHRMSCCPRHDLLPLAKEKDIQDRNERTNSLFSQG